MQNHRKRKLIKPRLQLRGALISLGVAALVVVFEATLMLHTLTRLATDLPKDGGLVMDEIPGIVLLSVGLTIAMLVPLMLAVGILTTHRVAGPVYRFEQYFKQLIAGETTDECRLRQGDELQELCELINRATAPLRATETTPAAEDSPAPAPAVPSGRRKAALASTGPAAKRAS